MLGDRIGSGSTLCCGIDWLCVGGGCRLVFAVNWGVVLFHPMPLCNLDLLSPVVGGLVPPCSWLSSCLL